MRYPSSLDNADPEGYKQAVELLGGSDNIITPLSVSYTPLDVYKRQIYS